MKKLNFDSGIKEYKINGNGVLRFNPADPNIYARFLEAIDKIKAVEEELVEQAGKQAQPDDGAATIQLMREADKRMKAVLSWVFGGVNDFDQILDGINLLAVGGNGERVVTNLFAALQPILVEGAQSFAKEKAAQLRAAR